MPVYADPSHGVSLSVALREAAAIAPLGRVMLECFELWQPIGTPDGPVYVVNDLQPLSANIEAGASRNPGVLTTFLPCIMDVQRPEESANAGTPEVTITVDLVSGIMSDALRSARGSLVPWELIVRVYASDDTTAPAILPTLQLYLTDCDISGDKITMKASFGDSVNVSVPRLTFKRAEYPCLVP